LSATKPTASTVICFTSLTLRYLARARVLAETLRAAHPDWRLHAVLVDQPPPGFPLAEALAAFDAVMPVEELAIPRVRAWLFKHDLVEACTAVKGAMLCHLLGCDTEAVVYFDPDIALFHPLRALPEMLSEASVLLTPHQLAPNDSPVAIADNELAALRYGVFNLGFLAVRNDGVGRAFAHWWAARLHEACYDEPQAGLFTDQRYCDLAPALFERIGVVRDPGWNVASWNLSRRRLAVLPSGDITVNGSPLAFYHFTKHSGVGDAMTDRYAGAAHEPHELWRWYGRRLAAHDAPRVPEDWWHYGRFSDGTPIPRAARLLYRQRADLMAFFDDPYDVSPGGLREWLEVNAPEVFVTAGHSGESRNPALTAGGTAGSRLSPG
jgi:hypothetical protein